MILAGITLSDNIVWLERWQRQQVSMSVKRTLGGGAVVYSGRLGLGDRGEKITLDAGDNRGWVRWPDPLSLQNLAAIVGAQYTLTYDGATYNVIFDFSGGPAVDLTPKVPRQTPIERDPFIGQIHLLTI